MFDRFKKPTHLLTIPEYNIQAMPVIAKNAGNGKYIVYRQDGRIMYNIAHQSLQKID